MSSKSLCGDTHHPPRHSTARPIAVTALEGVGLGLRLPHLDSIIALRPDVPFFEVMVEDYLSPGPHHAKLEIIAGHYPLIFHSVGLNVGGTDPSTHPNSSMSGQDIDSDNLVEWEYLKGLRDLYLRYQPVIISDHLCWSAHRGIYHHDLLPIHKTQAALEHVCSRIMRLQDFFDRQLCLENITSYLDYIDEQYTEIEFISEVIQRTGCSWLLDISNVLINHHNRGMDPKAYFDSFPLDHTQYVHLSGGSECDGWIIDSHSSEVEGADCKTLAKLRSQEYALPAIIERDLELPQFERFNSERLKVCMNLQRE